MGKEGANKQKRRKNHLLDTVVTVAPLSSFAAVCVCVAFALPVCVDILRSLGSQQNERGLLG